MKEINLTKGKTALVDDADFEWLNQFKWRLRSGHNIHYAGASVNGVQVVMHRLILGLCKGDKRIGDHIDRNGLNNQRNNIRICNHYGNMKNRGSENGSASQFKGVSYEAGRNRVKKWLAQIVADNKYYYLGHHLTEVDAAIAYNEAAKKYHGEFAFVNEIPSNHKNPDEGVKN